MADAALPEGWTECANSEGATQELSRELSKGHSLYGRDLKAIAVRYDCDDVLFRSSTGEMFVVHLTWRQAAEQPPFPGLVWKSTLHSAQEFNDWSTSFYRTDW